MRSSLPVLLAEDEENDIFFLKTAFQQANIPNPIQVVRDGQEAIEYLSGAGKFADRQQFPFPCLVLLDLKMPRRTGMDVLEWRHDHLDFRSLPVLVLSSSAHQQDIERAYELGANSFLVKPSSLAERLQMVKLIYQFWLQLNQVPAISIHGLQAARKLKQERQG